MTGLGRAMRAPGTAIALTGAAVLGLSVVVRLNVSPSAPVGFYRTVDGSVARGALVVTCVPPAAARVARDRGYLGTGPCPGGVQPILKPIGALPGDLVELAPDAVTVNGVRLPNSVTAARDSQDRPLPHVPWGRYLVPPEDVWLFATGTAQSWDSRYFGPIRLDAVRVVRPTLTLRGTS